MKTTKRHLHPLAILVFWGRYIISWFIIILLSLFTDHGEWNETAMVVVIILLVILLFAVFKYWWYRYEIGDQAITIYTGVIFRKQRHVPYNRIQTLQLQQWFFLKPFHAVSVQLETAGQSHDQAEAVLPVVSQHVVDQLQLLVNGEQPLSDEVPEVVDNRYHISWSDLNTYALTSMGIIPILLGLLWLYGKLDDLVSKSVMDETINVVLHFGVLVIVGLAVLLIIAGLLVSYLTIVQRYYHFILTKKGDRLHTEKGFFQRNMITASESRIQAVVLRQTVLRQLLGLISVQLVLVSSAAKEEDQDNLVMLPVIDQSKVAIVNQFVSWVPAKLPALTRLTVAGKYRLMRNAVLLSLIPIIPLVYWLRPWGWLSLLLLPIALIMGWYAGRYMGVKRLDHQLLVLQTGHHFQRDTTIVPKRCIQSVTIEQTYWMRRVGLCHLQVNIRHGDGKEMVEVRYLPLSTAKDVYQWYRTKYN